MMNREHIARAICPESSTSSRGGPKDTVKALATTALRYRRLSESARTGGGTWLMILMGLLALCTVVGVVYLSARITGGEHAVAEGRRVLAEKEPVLSEGKAELASGKQELSEGRQDYAEAEQRWHLVWADRLFQSGEGFRAAEEEIAEGEQAIASGAARVDAGQDRLDAGRLKLRRGRERLGQARHLRWALVVTAVLFVAASFVLGFRRTRAKDRHGAR